MTPEVPSRERGGVFVSAEALMTGKSPAGLGERLLAFALLAATPAYAAVQALRRGAYAVGLGRSVRLQEEIPGCRARVVSVGNITLGGSGKTPLVAELARRLTQKQGRRVGVIMRGYGGAASREGAPVVIRDRDKIIVGVERAGDEASLLAAKLPGCVVIVSPDRVKGAKLAVAPPYDCDLILLDDGFQHWRLARDVDLVILDVQLPPSAWRLFPRGYLREPLGQLKRAGALVVYDEDADQAATRLQELGAFDGGATTPVLTARQTAAGLIRIAESSQSSADSKDQNGDSAVAPDPGWRAFWFAGIARPRRIEESLEKLGADLDNSTSRLFQDHHEFTRDDLESIFQEFKKWKDREIAASPAPQPDCRLVCTQKDAVKIAPLLKDGDPPVEAIAHEARLIDPERWDEALAPALN